MKREFKYYRDSFAQLPVKVLHMDLDFDVYEDYVNAQTKLHVRPYNNLKTLQLNADDLEIHSITADLSSLTYNYRKEDKLVDITFEKEILAGEQVVLTISSTSKPTKNILEGLYYDETPKGCPCTMITQCQQWGFQRIVPCIDDMSAKCTYYTTIRGDKRYTNIISNGDPQVLMKDIGDNRVECVYDNTLTPMATYLFFMGLGTYATFRKEFRYPDGDTFLLELLVPPASDENIAYQALEVLHDAVMWVHLFTGKDRYKNMPKSKEIWRLMKEEQFAQAKELAEDLHLGYKYTGAVYREIGMQNSNFGGMENVGNTTITTNKIMPYPHMSDRGFEYMIQVKVHEFYHNLNGSEVTGATPFEFWLNEAVTVFTEQLYSQFVLGEEYERLSTISYIDDPQDGVLVMDRSPAAMPIEPEGFNHPDELVDSITYVKSPEVVRMVETLMGKQKFVEALELYHTRYKHGNAISDQWFECMSEVSGYDFTHFMQAWIRQKGHPTVNIQTVQKDSFKITLTQSNFEKLHYEFPFVFAVFSKEGKKIYEDMVHIKEVKQEINLNLDDVGFVSFNRSFHAFIDVKYEATTQELYLQVQYDDDMYAKNNALNKLFAIQRKKLLEDTDAEVDSTLIKTYGALFFNKDLQERVGTYHVGIGDFVEERYLHKYEELYQVRERMFGAIANEFEEQLLTIYKELDAKEYYGTVTQQRLASLKDRLIKNTALNILARRDTKEVQQLIKEQFLKSINASDKITAFRLYMKSSAPDREKILQIYQKEAQGNLVMWQGFLAAVASNQADDALVFIKEVEKSSYFRIEQAADMRGLFAVFANNKRKSLLTKEGREYLKYIAIKLAPINEYNTLHMMKTLDSLDFMDKEPQAELVKMVLEILDVLSGQKKVETVVSYLHRLLKGSPKAVASYENKYGELGLL